MSSKQFVPYDVSQANGLLLVKLCCTEAITSRTEKEFYKAFPLSDSLVAASWTNKEGRLSFKPDAGGVTASHAEKSTSVPAVVTQGMNYDTAFTTLLGPSPYRVAKSAPMNTQGMTSDEVFKALISPKSVPARPASVVKKVASIPSGLFRFASGRYG